MKKEINNTVPFKKQLKSLLGYTPRKIALYTMAFTHCSVDEHIDKNNERLEFLGDAILSAIVAEYLTKKYPYKGEGFLTDMRSKMVNRQKLNEIAKKMGIATLAFYNKMDSSFKVSTIFGNILEALIGAVYLDKGYSKTEKWVKKHIVIPYLFLDELENVEINYKNKIYGWASKFNHELDFRVTEEKTVRGRRHFTVGVFIDNKKIAEGGAFNKKVASEIAAQAAGEKIDLEKEEIQTKIEDKEVV